MDWMNSLKDPNTLKMLGLLGAGIAALIGGGWKVFTWLHPQPGKAEPAAPPQPATLIQAPMADNGGVALAVHGNGNQINTGK